MFGKKPVEKPIVLSVYLDKKIDQTLDVFKSTISRLESVMKQAEDAKNEKEQQIRELQTECNNLNGIVQRAENASKKISALFE